MKRSEPRTKAGVEVLDPLDWDPARRRNVRLSTTRECRCMSTIRIYAASVVRQRITALDQFVVAGNAARNRD